ncbi:MAG TPA: L-threonylcarbamoyladenylate synthase [Acidimicrobiia bacterium]|nr:L-threonylcarbamoyladenylate synthase [Acidimicrobiia bacterium]
MSSISDAVAALRRGGLVAFPTETVYGLGADAANRDAVRRLYAVKGRPPDHPVIAHIGRDATLDEYARDVPAVANVLARAFWPGPLTLILHRRPERVVAEVAGGRGTVGLRVPDHDIALDLLDAFGGAIAAPSANRFGRVSPTTAAHVRADLGEDVDVVLDGGATRVGVESTIVDCTTGGLTVLRVGAISAAQLAEVTGGDVPFGTGVAAPGTLASHYAPRARVELVDRGDVDARLAAVRAEGLRAGVLDAPADVAEYARVLYARLRAADDDGLEVVLAVLPPDDGGLGTVVRDRLRRAAG